MHKTTKSKIKTLAACLHIAFACVLHVAAQSHAFPNELSGYQFYGRGKLESVRLGVSTEVDVQRVFGEACKQSERCSLNDDWGVHFWYLEERLDARGGVPRPEHAGRLAMILMEPKRRHPFGMYRFPKAFSRGNASGGGSGHDTPYTYTSYQVYWHESSGLQLEYRLFSDTNVRYGLGEARPRKGDLSAIVYSISEAKQDEMYVKQ